MSCHLSRFAAARSGARRACGSDRAGAARRPAAARGPENIADVAEQVIDAVVNISTSQKVDARMSGVPDLPPGSPMEEFFDEFFKNRRGGQGGRRSATVRARRVNSLGSGFIIDSSGLVVTNNHVIADADEINVILNDGAKLTAELVGKDSKSDLARAARASPDKTAQGGEVRRFRQAAAWRMGDRHRQSVQPRRHRHRRHRLGAQPRHQFRARTTTTSRPTPPSIAAIPAGRCSTSTAR